jgi:2'-hydroxyisoflavone reductase
VGTFNALGPAAGQPMRSFVEDCRSAVGSTAKLEWVSDAFLEEQKVAPWSDMPVWIPADPKAGAQGPLSVARAVEKGLRFRPVADTARDTLAWYRTQSEERRAKLAAGLSAAREAEVLAAWHRTPRK